MSRQILSDIIKEFSPDKFEIFFRTKNSRLRYPKQGLGYEEEGNFSEGKLLAQGELSDGSFIVCSLRVKRELSERSGKKAQYEVGKRILRDTQTDAGIFIFYDAKGVSVSV